MENEFEDSYHTVALINMHFECDHCDGWLDDEGLSIQIPDDGWDHCMANAAKTLGWHVDTSAFDWVQLCPTCARRKIDGG